jgi:hypothetical protein
MVALFDVNDASSICCHILASLISMAFSNRVRHIIPLIGYELAPNVQEKRGLPGGSAAAQIEKCSIDAGARPTLLVRPRLNERSSTSTASFHSADVL